MVSRNLVICDQEERYAAALAHFFMKTKELALGVQVCNSVAQALRLQEESPIDILLIGSGYPKEERQKVRAESVFVLTQSEDVAHETHEKLINKYQSGEAILRDVIEQCQESVEPASFFCAVTGFFHEEFLKSIDKTVKMDYNCRVHIVFMMQGLSKRQ